MTTPAKPRPRRPWRLEVQTPSGRWRIASTFSTEARAEAARSQFATSRVVKHVEFEAES